MIESDIDSDTQTMQIDERNRYELIVIRDEQSYLSMIISAISRKSIFKS